MEGEPQLHAAAALPPEASYPFDGPTAEKIAWLTALGIGPLPLPADADADRRFQRFADRRVLAAIKGLSEAGEAAVTGGFVLSRRGLTFDSSLAVALFDERLTRERSREVFQFHRQLLASRLGERPEDLPADGAAVPPWSARRCRRASPATSACPSPRPATTPATASPPPTTPTVAPTRASAKPSPAITAIQTNA